MYKTYFVKTCAESSHTICGTLGRYELMQIVYTITKRSKQKRLSSKLGKRELIYRFGPSFFPHEMDIYMSDNNNEIVLHSNASEKKNNRIK